jgi:uncharacterized protein (TIGR02246 family)
MRRMMLCLTIGIALLAFTRLPTAVGGNAVQDAHSPNAGSPADTADLLEAKVRAAWSTFKMRDRDRYADFLTDDFQAVEADGDGERSKTRILREVERSVYTDYLLQLFQVQQLGQNHAFVTYEATMQFPAGSAVRFKRVFVGELWTERNGQWKMMRYQETPVR